MGTEELVEKLANLEFEAGHEFENGRPFYETLGRARAKGLLKALEGRGLVLASANAASLPICETGPGKGAPAMAAAIGARSS